ncbi:MAG: VTT domain-containing protein [Verrucomicrobiales bacterium]|nr:VTT domain-containing protein [Verrucomicrobiales bacterium]
MNFKFQILNFRLPIYMRIWWIFLTLAVLVMLPFLIWGDFFTQFFSSEGSVQWLTQYGAGAGIALLIGDLFLPVPGTVVMSAMGYVYGAWWGGVYSSLGSVLGGLLAYGLCRVMGHRAALFLAGQRDLEKGEHFFREGGVWVVVLSRWLPLLPEVVACMAGLVRMPFRVFLVALICGSVPLGFVFAWVGAAGQDSPALAMAMSAVLPVVMWLVARRVMGR